MYYYNWVYSRECPCLCSSSQLLQTVWAPEDLHFGHYIYAPWKFFKILRYNQVQESLHIFQKIQFYMKVLQDFKLAKNSEFSFLAL